MAEIIVVTWDGGGNVPPALAIARELAARGHGIRVLGHRSQRDVIEAAGFRAVPTPQARQFRAGDPHSSRDLLATFGDRGMGRDLMVELARQPADLVLVDALMFGALNAARASGVRYAVLEHFYDEYYRSALRSPLGLVLRVTGLRPAKCLRDAAVRVVTSLPELDAVHPLGSRHPGGPVSQVGPLVSWRPRVPSEPTVLVSLSTFGYSGMAERLRTAVEGCAGLPARIVVTTGPRIEPASVHAPAGVEVHRFVPHDELMPEVSVLLGHGGHGTTMTALAHDVPVAVLPLDPRSDHEVVGRSLERTGAGRLLSRTASADEIRVVVASLLADGPHRDAVARLGARIRSSAGAVGAAEALESTLPAQAHRASG